MSESSVCFFTGSNVKVEVHPRYDALFVESEDCGLYIVPRTLTFDETFKRVRSRNDVVQGYVNCARRSVVLREQGLVAFWCYRTEVKELEKTFIGPNSHYVACAFEDAFSEPVDHSIKPYELLDALARRQNEGKAFGTCHLTVRDQIWARICDRPELTQMALFLKKKGLIDFEVPNRTPGLGELNSQIIGHPVQITVDGWEKFRLRNSFPHSNKVFIATKFVWPEENDVREKALQAIKEACRACGYDAEIVGQNHTGNITDQIIAEIQRSRFVIAELSYNNRGVYFEAGYARGIGRPVFHVIRDGHTDGADEEGKRVHFDIQQVMYRKWRTPEELQAELTVWIEAVVGKSA